VSTNAAEGLFGRVKMFCRERQLKRISKKTYGLVLAEFLWRASNVGVQSEWASAPLWKLLDFIADFQKADGLVVCDDPYRLPAEAHAELSAWRESHREVVPPPPPQAPVLADAPPGDATPPPGDATPLPAPGDATLPPAPEDDSDIEMVVRGVPLVAFGRRVSLRYRNA
jgi:hypothetical protein